MSKTHRIILVALSILAIFLRISLALANRESSDDHLEVVHLILKNGSLPTQADCWECFQPKLYHFTVATIIKGLSLSDPDAQIITAQLINVLASLFMLWFVWLLIRQLNFANDTLKVFGFGLLALNPGLVSINIQATNDTFAITFSVLALYFAYQMISSTAFRLRDLAFMVIFTTLAILSKTNCINTALAIFITLVFKAILDRNFSFDLKKGCLASALLFATFVSVLVVFNPLGQYLENYRRYGSPVLLTINVPPQPFPDFWEKTETYKAGILSIQDGFFTFKLADLLEHPQITPSNKIYPENRTSFWTVLYARAYFLHYNSWPPSWVTNRPEVFLIGRLIYLAALLPTLAIFVGLALDAYHVLTFTIRPLPSVKQPLGAGLFLITLGGYIAFLILYTLQYRMYSVIKAVFIYPAMPSLIVFYLYGAEWLYQLAGQRNWIKYTFNIWIGLLLGLSILEITALLLQLTLFR